MKIRSACAGDLEELYAICLVTGDKGQDATAIYTDPMLIGHIYVGPYVDIDGTFSLVVEDDEGVAGYVAGVVDTHAFEARLEQCWWPELRNRYDAPSGDRSKWSADQIRCDMIHNPKTVPDDILDTYPAHVHMNLAPRAQGRGVGSRLLSSWCQRARAEGVVAVHAGVSAQNQSGLNFWSARGFLPIRTDDTGGSAGTVWCGKIL